MLALPPLVGLDFSVGGILTALGPYAIYVVIVIAVLVLAGAVRAWAVAAGEAWGVVGVFGILLLLGLFLIATGWTVYGLGLAGISLFFLVISGLSSKRTRQHGERS